MKTAIVVDDHPEICTLVASQLRKLGIAAQGMTSKADLVQALDSPHPDLLLLDLSLGESDAVEIFSVLNERGYTGRVVLMSGHSGSVLDHARRIGERAGVEIGGTLRKPFRRRELETVVSALGGPAVVAPPHRSEPVEPGLLRAALDNGWVEFWFQPKIDLRSDAIAGMEALARIRHPERGVLAPSAFLPPIEDIDLHDLTVAAARAALALCARSGSHLPASINVAGRTILRPGLIEALKALGTGVEQRLIIEITETDLIGDLAAAEAFATRAVLHGFSISIDDFGTGYATFERLRHIPFAELKIERAIVHGCAEDEALRKICRAAVELGHGFDAKVVAEGVETRADLDTVRALGFDLAQGY
ncbi:EAL domain-containing response regulator, partial [Elioraea sp.]|uniref:EAL domain-containing response regulator n=1 Tax=Elioraea sp. TaxID=2185103 RepID=UPI003F7154A3